MSKGKIIAISDTTLLLKNNNNELTEIPVTSIGSIKTKRTEGRNIFIGAAIGIPIGAYIGQVDYKPGFLKFPRSTYSAIGGGVGALGGALTGLISTAFKESKAYKINGHPANWKVFLDIGIDYD